MDPKHVWVCGACGKTNKSKKLTRDPETIMPPYSGAYVARTRALTPHQFLALLAQLPPGRAAHVAWIVLTGARRGEAERAMRADHARGVIRLRGTKTDLAPREVPILDGMRTILAWILERAGERKMFATWGNMYRDLEAACERAKMDKVTPNDLRRTYATWMRQSGIDVSLIAVAMGHKDGRMVERIYGRLDAKSLGRVLGPALDGQVPQGYQGTAESASSGHPLSLRNAGNFVPRDRIELSTRGFSIPPHPANPSGNSHKTQPSVPPGPQGERDKWAFRGGMVLQ